MRSGTIIFHIQSGARSVGFLLALFSCISSGSFAHGSDGREIKADSVSAQFSSGDGDEINDTCESVLTYLPYRDPLLAVEQRIEDLLSRMTLEEKIGQLNMPFVLDWVLESSEEEARGIMMEFVEGRSGMGIGPIGGLFALPNTLLFGGPEEQARYLNTLQRKAMTNTRLGIPLIQTEEGTHGLRCSGGTIFPEGPALGSTWNLDLIGQVYEAVAREARAIGVHQLFTLVVEPIRDPRMGRNQEAYSEDPFQTATIAETIVRAVQGHSVASRDKVIAGLGHFPGQSSPVSGLERGAMEISERILREVFLPPWEAGIKNAGALGVMATYASIDGVPTHASSWLLEEILRGEFGFEGLVLSEGGGIETLIYSGLAENYSEAAAMSANAGLDVCITPGNGYEGEMISNVMEGTVSEETINRSVKRVLDMKFRLGLFENPFVDPQQAVNLSHTLENKELALQAGRESIVLLKNENQLLPLEKHIKSVAVIGPNADDERNQLGDYTSTVISQEITTCLEGILNKLGEGTVIRFVKGCDVTGSELDEIDKAVEAAQDAEVAIVVLGENEWMKSYGGGTVGEGYDVATLELTGLQKELVRRIHATGTPTIVILINGRPLAIPWIKEHVPAIIEAWNPGEKGGEAIADILFGDYNPSGKLTVTFPRHAGQLPVYYNHKPSKTYWLENGWGNSYADMENAPLFEFGFGLSYTCFEYENLVISPASGEPFGHYSVTLEVRNSGDIAGAEVVQLYIRDNKSTVVRPVKELKGFAKIELDPGQSVNVKFELGFNELKSLDRNMNWVVEPGTFTIMVGSSSDDIRLKGEIEVR